MNNFHYLVLSIGYYYYQEYIILCTLVITKSTLPRVHSIIWTLVITYGIARTPYDYLETNYTAIGFTPEITHTEHYYCSSYI